MVSSVCIKAIYDQYFQHKARIGSPFLIKLFKSAAIAQGFSVFCFAFFMWQFVQNAVRTLIEFVSQLQFRSSLKYLLAVPIAICFICQLLNNYFLLKAQPFYVKLTLEPTNDFALYS